MESKPLTVSNAIYAQVDRPCVPHANLSFALPLISFILTTALSVAGCVVAVKAWPKDLTLEDEAPELSRLCAFAGAVLAAYGMVVLVAHSIACALNKLYSVPRIPYELRPRYVPRSSPSSSSPSPVLPSSAALAYLYTPFLARRDLHPSARSCAAACRLGLALAFETKTRFAASRGMMLCGGAVQGGGRRAGD
ncbi:hypothetical protein JCM6882_000206 [Rhodosporidiobolus microsporus]